MASYLEVVSRKFRTFSDKIYSWVVIQADSAGVGLSYAERLDYLKLRQVFHGNKNMVIYDIGANNGMLGIFWSKLNQVETIYAFEPISSVFAELQRNTKHISKIVPINIALGDVSGELTMNVNDWNPSSSLLSLSGRHMTEFPFAVKTESEKISVARLDDVVTERSLKFPDLVKIDVQGYEDKVLFGGANVIRQARFCIIELSLDKLYEGCPQITDIISIMDELGFNLVDIVGEVTGQTGRFVQLDGLFRKRND